MKPSALFLVALLAGTATAQQPQHAIREDAPRVGSNIRRNLAESASIPVNLPYEQLSPADRRQFHENYVSIADGDEPPAGLQAVLKPITQAQQRLLSRGELFLVATVSAAGEVTTVTAHGSPSPEMTKFAAQALLLTPFKPAVCGGQACEMEFPLRIRFTVR
ncbi:MAG: hypothetical protein QM750_20810 [Rubrivivax sp.]